MATSLSLGIVHLERLPHLIPMLAGWFRSEWPAYYGRGGPGDAEADLHAYCNAGSLPLGLVALWDEQPCGFAALKSEPFASHPHLLPWAGAAYVEPSMRRRGIGRALFGALEREAAGLGYPRVYCATATSASLLRRCEWHLLDRTRRDGQLVEIYEKKLVAVVRMERTPRSLEFALQVKKQALGPYIFDRWGWDETLQRRNAIDRWERSQPFEIRHDGQAVGVLTLHDSDDRTVIDELYVMPQFHGRGVGGEVVRGVIAQATERRMRVSLQCLRWNTRALAFYRRHGFAVAGETETHFVLETDGHAN